MSPPQIIIITGMQSKFIKRLIVAVIIFLVPSLLQLLLSIASNIWPEIDATMCGIFSK